MSEKKEKGKGNWFFRLTDKAKEDVLAWIEKWFSTLRGKVDVKSRLMLLLNPDNIVTSTRLSPSQVRFVSGSYWIASKFPIFEGLRDYAKIFCEAQISLKGQGREESIRFVGALQESKLLQRMGVLQKEAKEVKED